MNNQKKFEYLAIGFVLGLGMALLFLIWGYSDQQAATNQFASDFKLQTSFPEAKDQHNWISGYEGYVFAEESLAQWMVAAFTAMATVFSAVAVFYTVRTFRETRRVGIIQNRAYLGISDFSYKAGDDYPFVIVSLKNSGHTPAKKVRYIIWWTPEAPTGRISAFEEDDFSVFDIPAGQTTELRQSIDGLNDLNKKNFLDGHFPIWIEGMIQYYDMFDQLHHTWFRYKLVAKRKKETKEIIISSVIEQHGNEST